MLNSRLVKMSRRLKKIFNYLSNKVKIRLFLVLRLRILKKKMVQLKVKLCLIKEMDLRLRVIFGLRLLMRLLLKFL
jgi:hypothetical protein